MIAERKIITIILSVLGQTLRPYSAAIESAACLDTDPSSSAFAQRMRREADRRGFMQAPGQVILGDGAAWIWRTAAEDYLEALPIVDLWHAKEPRWFMAKALSCDTPTHLEAWACAHCDDLEQGRFDSLLATLRSHAATCPSASQCADYLAKNRSCMRYPEFRAQGLCVGSGVVESGCKSVVGARLKQVGMHRTVSGVNAILALRCCVLSGGYEDYWAQRADSPLSQNSVVHPDPALRPRDCGLVRNRVG